jgi:hypothetical protein
MKDSRLWEPGIRDPLDPRPRHVILLTAAPERPPPEVNNVVTEGAECSRVRWYCVVREVSAHHLPEPFSLRRYRFVHAPPQVLLDLPELRPHAITSGLPLQLEGTATRSSADKDETQEGEGLRPAKTSTLAVGRCVATKLQ